jgi:S-DNA-T family DNA segregation ATPase FtsK/SpoIIIE
MPPSSALRNSRARARTFLPAGLKDFCRRRAVEAGGIALFAVAATLAVSLATFSVDDPNFNHATAKAPLNLMGRPGAYTADLLLQTLGAAALLPVLALAAWSWRIVSHRGLPRWWMNVAALPLALVLLAGALASLPVPAHWPLHAGFGGVIGDGIVTLLAPPLAAVVPGAIIALPLALGLAALAVVPILLTFGLSLSDWQGLGRGIGHGMGWTATGLWRGSRTAGSGLRSMGDMIGAQLRREPKLRTDEPDEEPDDGTIATVLRRASRAAGEPLPVPAPRAIDPEGRSEPRVEKRAGSAKTGKKAAQPALKLKMGGEFELPGLEVLTAPPEAKRVEKINEDALEQNARMLESTLAEFGVVGEIVKVRPGPVVTLYELEPAPGTKSSRVIGLADDIARSMSALSARIAVIPGRNAIGIELPNLKRETVFLREMLGAGDYESSPAKLALALGKDIGGAPVIADLSRMPHLLVAGTTGSGKSVAINTMILSLLYRLTPDQCKFIMVDPKMLELSVYDGIPHLLAPVVTEPAKAIVALKWTVREMEERYRKMSELGVRNIAGYNQRLADAKARGEKLGRTVQTGFDAETGNPVFEERPLDLSPLPFIVVIVDELADLMLVAGKDIEAAIQRLAQMARAAGIHLIVATQRPSVDVITGTIKANFPTRISFQVTSKIDSRTILGEQGAEQLLGMGDMLFMEGGGRIKRVHGPFVTDEEVDKVVAILKAQGEPDYVEGVTAEPEEKGGFGGGGDGGESDQLYDQAVALVCRERKASTSFVQRHLQIGYNRAARIIERMESEGVVGKANHVGKREVLAPEGNYGT